MKSTNNFNFAGLNGFIWWMGQIENRADPLGMGRCQVRIFGWYGDEIVTEDLPWAMPMYPINNSKYFEAPPLYDWVIGFFMDGEAAQSPIMLGVIPGIKQETEETNYQGDNYGY
jgi:hypothetical protein